MSPSFFLLGISSSTIIWVITTAGFPPECWTMVVVPFLSVYCLCNHRKLSEAVGEVVRSPRALSIVVGMFSVIYTGFVPLKLLILLGCIFCICKAFSFEKMMYMDAVCGEIAKSICWKIAAIFWTEADRMRWKGEWAYCSPYSRKLIQKEIDFYYTLKPKSHETSSPEPYNLDFVIEDCQIVCKYSDGGGGDYSPRSGVAALVTAIATAECRQEEDVSLTLIDDMDKIKEEASSTQSTSGELEEVPSLRRTGALNGEDRYSASRRHLNKLEVSLSRQQGNETLEAFTFYRREAEGMVEVKRALEILRDHGNLIFASLHRNIGSCNPKAHARCYEFKEIFDLILVKGYELHKVTLQSKCMCYISGSAVLKVLSIGLLIWMQYYQLSSAPKVNIVIILTLFFILEMSLEHIGSMEVLKRSLYSLIQYLAPDQVEGLYRYFQVKLPYLTFCNESYGHPYTANRSELCYFPDIMLPIINTQPRDLILELPLVTMRTFDLLTLDLQVDVRHHAGALLEVDVLMHRKYDGVECYHKLFKVQGERQIANLVAIFKWLEDNNCVGVCKEWPRRNLMHAYTYEELLHKVLKEGAEPWIIYWDPPFDIRVEGLHCTQ